MQVLRGMFMRKYNNIIKPVIFSIVLVCLLCVFSFIFSPKNNMGEFGMTNIAAHGYLGEKENTIDVLFIGDSLAYSSFFPLQMYDEYGFTSYTVSTPAQKLYETYDYFESFLEHQNPQVVVFENGNLLRDFLFNEALTAEIGRYLPVITYHNRWKNLNFNDFTSDISYTYTNPTKGYKKIDNIKPTKKVDYMKKNKNFSKISKQNIYYLKRMKNLCEKKGIDFLMVSTITLKSMNYARHNAFSKIANDEKIKYIDLNLVDDIKIDWEKDTYDSGEHLNYNGAQKVSKYMGKYLQDEYDLKNRKNDEKYKNWNEYLKNFKNS